MRLLVVEGLDGCGKDYLMNKMLELNKMIYCVRDDCHGIKDLNEHINRLTTSRSRSLYSLLEYVFMRKIEEAYSNRKDADFAITSRFLASTYAYQVYTGDMDSLKFEQMERRVSDYADYYGVKIEYIFRDINPEDSIMRIKDGKDEMDRYCMEHSQKIRTGYIKYFGEISPHFSYLVDQIILTDRDIEELMERINYSKEFTY